MAISVAKARWRRRILMCPLAPAAYALSAAPAATPGASARLPNHGGRDIGSRDVAGGPDLGRGRLGGGTPARRNVEHAHVRREVDRAQHGGDDLPRYLADAPPGLRGPATPPRTPTGWDASGANAGPAPRPPPPCHRRWWRHRPASHRHHSGGSGIRSGPLAGTHSRVRLLLGPELSLRGRAPERGLLTGLHCRSG
jgi:hypothetical protein